MLPHMPFRTVMATTCAVVACAFASAAGCATRGPSGEPPRVPEAPLVDAGPPDTGAETDAGPPAPRGNTRIRGFDEAKKLLVRLYLDHSPKRDVYCGCPFGAEPGRGLRVDLLACGYTTFRDRERAERIEWEHAVPAAKFGRTFVEWREGDDRCVDGRGKRFRGRSCARLASPAFARMEGDLHNLFPAVGEVNGLRGDLPMGLLDGPEAPTAKGPIHFGQCTSAIEGAVFMPRREVRGDLARAYKYMDAAYPERHILDDAHRSLFDGWDAEDPPDAWELERNRRIEELQGNGNPFIR